MTVSPNSRRRVARTRRIGGGALPIAFVIALVVIASLAARPAEAQSAIAVEPLPEVRVDTIGVLDALRGGFEADLWRKSNIPLIERLLGEVAATSPTTWSLLYRLTLSTAAPPAGDAGGARLLAQRAALSWRLGDLDGLADLLGAAPRTAQSGTVRRLNAELLFLVGADFEACGIVDVEVARDDAEYWQRALIACQALVGDPAKVDLGLALLREVDGVDESGFASLVGDVLSGEEGQAPPRGVTSGYEFALASRAKTPIDIAGVSDEAALMAAIAAAPWVDTPIRVTAAERNARLGGPVEGLRRLYGGDTRAHFRTFAAGDREQKRAKTWPQPRPRPVPQPIETVDTSSPSALYQAVVGARQTSDRARALDAALSAAREAGTLLTAARLYAPWLDGLLVSNVTAPVALNAARAQLARHRGATVRPWLALAERSEQLGADAAVLERLTAIGDLTGGTAAGSTLLPFDAATLAAITPAPGDRALLLGVADAVDADVPAEFWLPLLDTPAAASSSRPTMARARLARDAAAKDRLGEAVLLAIGLLGPEGPRGATPEALALAVEVLMTAGLPADARALAAEALAVRL